MKIVYVANVAWFFVSHRLCLAREAKHRGWEASVIAAADSKVKKIIEEDINFNDWKVVRGRRGILKEVKSFYSLRKKLHSERPDIIHLVGIKAILYGGLNLRFFGKRNSVVFAVSGRGVVASQTSTSMNILAAISKQLYRVVFSRKNYAIIVQNRNDFSYFVDNGLCPPHRLTLINGSGVNIRDFFYEKEPEDDGGETIVLLAARMLWSKGVEQFVSAGMKCVSSGVNAKFVIAGKFDPDSPDHIPKEKLEEWSGMSGIVWLGHVDDMPQLIRSCAIVCLPTTYGEGVPKILLEGLASGRPVITTDWPGCNEVVEDGITGLLVKPGCAISLESSIRKLLDSKNMRTQMGLKARETAVSKFSERAVIKDTFEVYEKLLSELNC